MSTKGGGYEIEVCRDLSNWWSGGTDDDWFWRASQSGGRATTRAKKGKTTTGHHGDIAASCPEATALTNFITFEIKRGYNRSAFLADMLDRETWPANKSRKGTMLGFFEQVIKSSLGAGTPYWALIHRRDKREPVIYIPYRPLGRDLQLDDDGCEYAILNMPCLDEVCIGLRFEKFLEVVDRDDIKKLIKRSKRS